MSLSNTTCTVSENVIKITENSKNNITVNETQKDTKLHIPVKISETIATAYAVDAHNHMTSSNLQTAIQELEDTFKRQTSEPASYEKGSLWYDTDDNELKVAREVSGSLQFVPLASATGTMDILDGGSFT